MLVALAPLLAASCRPVPDTTPTHRVIFIDVDDHGLKALWDAHAPHLQKLAREGVLGFTRVDLPTHSNHNNFTLLTGAWPEVTNAPHNGWLERSKNFQQALGVGPLSIGWYVYYDRNPLGGRVESLYTSARAAGLRSAYVGLLPPFERGADDVHFTINGAKILEFTVTKSLLQLALQKIDYPRDVINAVHWDGPPDKGETLNHFTLRDAARIFDAAADGGEEPPPMMFVWTFIALDGNPTNEDGAAGPGVKAIVEKIDDGVGQLIDAVARAGYADDTSYVITLDHGKVDTHNQVAFSAQLAALIDKKGASYGLTKDDVRTLDEDGDVHLYAVVKDAGTAAGAAAQLKTAHAIVDMIHDAADSGAFVGLDTSRTVTWDGYRNTLRLFDIRSTGPNNPDIIMFPADDWTLNDPMGTGAPGPISGRPPYGRHGGFSIDELYVPVIFAGPAFKHGKVLPVPIDHADIAPTVAAALGVTPPATAQGGVVNAALANQLTPPWQSNVELLDFFADPHDTRPAVLANAGYDGPTPKLAGAAAAGVVLIDVSKLYADGLLPGANVATLAHDGVTLTGMRARFRDWPTTEYQMLTGSYPARTPWVPFAEADPDQAAPPGQGLFAMPPAPLFIANTDGYDAWHSGSDVYGQQTVLAAAHDLGLATAVLGAADFHLRHVARDGIDVTPDDHKSLDDVLAAAPGKRAFVLLAVDGGDDPVGAADAAVASVQRALQKAGVAGRYVIALTSRGAAPIDDADTDARGPGSARHVPLIIAGPNIRAGVVIDGPATPADLAPTLLYAVGAAARAPDLAFGVQLDGGMSSGAHPYPRPLPHDDRAGRVLLQAFR